MKQLQQTAAVTGNSDVLLKVVTPFFLKPALAAELSDQEAGPAGDITQFLLVDILPFKCCVRQLLLQFAAQHGIQCVLAYFQVIAVCTVQHVQRICI